MKYCDSEGCHADATEQVKVSVDKAHDDTRNFCDSCFYTYLIGVQHGRFHEAALHGTVPGRDSSQNKPKKQKLLS